MNWQDGEGNWHTTEELMADAGGLNARITSIAEPPQKTAVSHIALGKHFSRINFIDGQSLAVVMHEELREKPERDRQRTATVEQLRKLAGVLGVEVKEILNAAQ